MKDNFSRYIRTSLAPLALSLLGACTTMTNVPPGTPLTQVEAEFGRANFSCPAPDGGQRLIWTGQPYGQYAWGTNVDSAGRTNGITSLLTTTHFRVLSEGEWTPDKVQCEFGPPAEISTVGLPSVRQIVWSYRFLENGAWNSLMHVYFGKDGSRVTHFHPGPDPMYDIQDWFF